MTFIQEAQQAARGCVAVLRGEVDASRFFNLTAHGLVGALLAL
jgi:hypothetical protein